MAFPRTVLTGERIVLRPNRPEFSAYLVDAVAESIGTVGRWMTWCHPHLSESEALDWYMASERNWETGSDYEFSIFTPAGEYLGGAGLNQFNETNNFANLGYWIRESRQCQGFATEAARLLAGFGLGSLQLHRIEIVVADGNLPSRRVAEKVGGAFEGTLRARLMIHGRPLDAAMYSLTRDAEPLHAGSCKETAA